MITHKEIPGGGGGENRTDGRYVSNMRDGSALEITNGVRIDCPQGSNVLYPRIPPVGEFKIAGQCSPDKCDLSYEWRAGVGWAGEHGSVGVNPVIYDYKGQLFRVTYGGPYNTQGFRAVTWPSATFPGGQLVMCNDTMSTAPDGHLLHEYTLFAPGYYGGQGHDEGTHIVTPDGKRFVLSHGDNRFTRWTYDPSADILAVAISDLSRRSVRFWWMSLADIRTLEPFESTPPIDPPIDPPPIDPPPTGGTVQIPPQAIANTKALGAKHPELLNGDDDQRRALMKLICEQNRFDLGPAHGWKSADPGRPPSKDAIAFQAGAEVWVADMFTGTPPRAYSGATDYEKTVPPQNFIAVNPVNHLGTGPIDPPPIDPPPPSSDLEARVAALESRVNRHLQP